jgi:hypothetical protein
MNKLAAVTLAALPMLATTARADDSDSTESANTVVVVTPQAPIVVTSGQAAAPVVQAPGSVEAPPAPPATNNGAPQNEAWSNVNHINGTPVKVGERNDYLIAFKKTNISANPFGLFWGYFDADVAHALTQNIALSGSLAYYNHSDETMVQATVSAPIYFRRTFSGPFLEPGLIYRSSSYNDSYAAACAGCMDTSNQHSWFGPELLFGWHWNFDSGLNISWAVGVAAHATDTNSDGSSNHDPDFNGYFRVGYNF